MVKHYLSIVLVAILSLGILSACGSSNDDSGDAVSSPAQSSNAAAISTATAQSELADTWTPTPEPEQEEGEVAAGPGGPVEIQIEAVDIAFDVAELEGPADTDFTVTLTNNGAAEHDFVIVDTDFATELLASGESQTITVNLPAGEYKFICSVPGHEAAGMVGTLTILEGGGASVAASESESGEEGTGGAPVEIQVEAVDIAFDQKELEAPADTDFTITLTNKGSADHDFVIEGTEFKTSILAGGESETITVNLPAGEYTFFCSVPGHRPAGMEGTLIVSEGGGATVAPAGESSTADDESSTPADESAAPADAAASGPVEIEVIAVDIAFDQKELEGPADTDFTITLINNGAADHDFVIEGTDFKTEILAGGESQTITVNLPAGEYTFFCSVPGHRPAGMEGTLIVSEGGGAAAAPAGDDAETDGATSGDATADDAGSDAASSGAPVELQLSAIDIAFEQTELEGPADTEFTITVTNNGAADHDFVIEGTEFKTSMLGAGESETITVTLPAGEYTFFCSVPGHRPAGMEGTLTITEGGGAAADEAESEDAAAGEAVEIQVEAVDIAFDQKEIEAPADTEFTITLTNNGAADHDFVIEGTDFKTEILAAGESQTITVTLPAGEYTFYCSVPGHRPAGMEGTLKVG